ncbi:Immunoglobulin heavy variable 3-33 [Anabarilius grahami]|nr:Immunoglobulin heavy variable 3-33 [Anabarilius grahami]
MRELAGAAPSSGCKRYIIVSQPSQHDYSSSAKLVIRELKNGVHCVELTQTDSMVLSPGQVLTLSCKISGYSVTDSSYGTGFIRQAAGKALEWVGEICGDGSTYYSDKLKSRYQVSRDSSSNTVTLQGQNMQTEDTAVYYCARESQ